MAGRRKSRKKRSKIPDIFLVVILLMGIGILFYPAVSDLWNRYRNELLISSYNSSVEQITKEESESVWNRAQEFNAQHKINTVQNVFAEENGQRTENGDFLALNQDGVIGSIEIPSISVKLAIYLGLEEKVLEKGCGYMQGTSLPVGGTNSHSVLAAHRGLPSAKLFTDLDQVEVGEMFYIQILGKTLAYEIEQIKTVLPSEIEELDIIPNKDCVTLVTCTPYGVNTHRLLVRGTRTEYIESDQTSPEEKKIEEFDYESLLVIPLVILVIGGGILSLSIRKSRKGK